MKDLAALHEDVLFGHGIDLVQDRAGEYFIGRLRFGLRLWRRLVACRNGRSAREQDDGAAQRIGMTRTHGVLGGDDTLYVGVVPMKSP
ncbi:MAG TPA: hypothetical protein VNH46_03925 [Gemmatimonadales bacterium]|nr:hypothetical protein [Gemmatimonadales bacterium]